MAIPTPHIGAKEGEIAKIVILTGDPRRIPIASKKFLTKSKCVSKVRGNFCYTGYYNGKRVSIMSCGMGAPSMGIYSYELYNFYGVEYIIRVGTAGSLNKNLRIGDVVASRIVDTDTNIYGTLENAKRQPSFRATKKLLKSFVDLISPHVNLKTSPDGKTLYTTLSDGHRFACGRTFSTDTFYEQKTPKNALCVDMECGALYLSAKKFKKEALCLLTISDEVYSGKSACAKEYEIEHLKTFELALKVATNGELQ